jgi:N-acetylgalactosamine 4-sulfate 6-O-sulfotransferase
LPFAHVLGVSKCGTTDLYSRLSRHPNVLPSANKGPHFWDERHPLRWYVDLYATGASRLYSGASSSDSIFIDASSNTLTYAGVGVRGEQHPHPPLVLPQVLGWLQPNARLILMVREPSSRYYSAYWYYDRRYRIYSRRFGRTGADAFAKMVTTDVAEFSSCRQTSTARRCARSTFYVAEQLVKGMYSLFLEPWLATFPASQLLVLRVEDYRDAPTLHIRQLLAFLSLPKPSMRVWHRMISQPQANRRAPGGEPMLAHTQRTLIQFYSEFNEQLAAMMGDDRYLEWNRQHIS